MGAGDSPGGARSAPLTHAGAVAVRNGREVLLVRSTARDAVEWVLPKGHIERGESAEQAALRELREEAGVIGRIVRPVHTQQLPNGAVIAFFFVEAHSQVAPEESRESRWLTFDDAMRLATFDETRATLEAAWK
ncbi:MAG: hypothetical protein DMF56_02860 [Acidobacteria bacterium]|nr:MAG: hypothetical protein DMF56_02860 [Acidobacteriota bacterium]